MRFILDSDRQNDVKSRTFAAFCKWSTKLGNTPGIIKYPFWQMTNTFQHAFYVCLNQGEAYAPEEIRKKSGCMNEDIGEILKEL